MSTDGIIPGSAEDCDALRAERDQLRKRLDEAGVTVRALVETMEMQENRESGAFHIAQPTAKYLWDKAKDAGKAFLSSEYGPPPSAPAPVAPEALSNSPWPTICGLEQHYRELRGKVAALERRVDKAESVVKHIDLEHAEMCPLVPPPAPAPQGHVFVNEDGGRNCQTCWDGDRTLRGPSDPIHTPSGEAGR